jgi:hypothetical protein
MPVKQTSITSAVAAVTANDGYEIPVAAATTEDGYEIPVAAATTEDGYEIPVAGVHNELYVDPERADDGFGMYEKSVGLNKECGETGV